jgi:DNA end-binding protein Ku
MMTLRSADEVRDHKEIFADIKEEPPAPEMLQLAEQLIEQKSGAFDPSEFRDRYRDAVLEMAAAKVEGQEPVLAKAPQPGRVINLMDALKRSLEQTTPAVESRPRQAAGTEAASRQAISAVRCSGERAPESRNVASRGPPTTLAVVSAQASNVPSIVKLSAARIGL